MIKKLLLFIIILTFSKQIFAQELPPIQLDRPDQTECPFIVPKGYLQAEVGFTFEGDGADKSLKTFVLPTVLWKYGVNEKFELRFITEINSESKKVTDYQRVVTNGLAPITVGFKAKLAEENGIFPEAAFIGHLTSNKVATDFKAKTPAPSFRFLMQHTLNDRMSLSYNVGAEWNGLSPEIAYIYTLSNGISVSEKIGFFYELYGFLPQTLKNEHNFDAGVTYLINNNLMLDLSASRGLNNKTYYVAVGISNRLKIRKKG